MSAVIPQRDLETWADYLIEHSIGGRPRAVDGLHEDAPQEAKHADLLAITCRNDDPVLAGGENERRRRYRAGVPDDPRRQVVQSEQHIDGNVARRRLSIGY